MIETVNDVRTYYYIRVSSIDQNIIRQLYLLNINEFTPLLYIDKDTGSKIQRKNLNKLLKTLEQDKSKNKVLKVSSMDRLSRSLKDLNELINKITDELNTTIIFTSGPLANIPISNSQINPSGKLILNIFGSFSEYEREIIKERQAIGIMKWKSSDSFIHGIKKDTYKKYQKWNELKVKNPNLKIKELETLTSMSNVQYRRCLVKEKRMI